MRLRIPAWASQSTTPVMIRVNGNRTSASVNSGFATIKRRWKDGDRIELELPMTMRLEAIDSEHPDTVALVRGPLVLFPITEKAPRISRQQLLAAGYLADKKAWQADTASGPLQLLPFTSIQGERYTTYVALA
jgi:hypothetical protein